MALKFVKKLNVRRDDNSAVFPVDLTATADTGQQADAALAAQVQAKLDAAQGSADELAQILAGL